MNAEQMKQYQEYERTMQEVLPAKRFAHSRGVAYTAGALAMCYGEDMYAAMVAGILHDCAKPYTDRELIEHCIQNNICVSDVELQIPHLLHGKYGAFLAHTKYGIKDQTILDAIEFHTMGRENMSVLEKIIFIADYIEPTRTHEPNPPLSEIRRQAFEDLNRCIVTIIRCVLAYLDREGWLIGEETIQTLRYYERMVSNE